jgi:hypothetical protein
MSQELCERHGEMIALIKSIDEKTERIEVALLGTLEKAGFITTSNSRLDSLEKFKVGISRSVTWLITAVIGTIIAAISGSCLK